MASGGEGGAPGLVLINQEKKTSTPQKTLDMAGKAMESLLILKMSYPTIKQDIKGSKKSAHLKNITFTI